MVLSYTLKFGGRARVRSREMVDQKIETFNVLDFQQDILEKLEKFQPRIGWGAPIFFTVHLAAERSYGNKIFTNIEL